MRGSVQAVPSTYYINGNAYFSGKTVLYNSKRNPNFQSYLDHLTESIQPSFGAVRNIYTPDSGHRVARFQDLQPNAKYVVGGYEIFRPYK
ncbi:hypothetical protein LOTGIDRAFT_145734 [Lottia gigantea]|uniref:Doublecortin domain-containing protein n=1 Tax=Lottia gigantea TaxID=225164 RepID=V4BP67_LOTGI|nr:hypothetical protein LOTGIDRAFT_145734 [Lottia gigantea]ESO90754.1 hypothetical protein LOTGIDRAFT_145734 [Lottia gigantea]